MKRKRWTRSEIILLCSPLGFVALALGILRPPEGRVFRSDVLRRDLSPFGPRETGYYQTCNGNLRQLGLAMLQYAQDNDERFPLVASGTTSGLSGTVGWSNAIFPYVKSQMLFRCPQRPTPFSRMVPIGESDYYLNARLATRDRSVVFANSILLGEGNDNSDWNDECYAKTELPARWRSDRASPAHRHLTNEVWAKAGANYAFPDGHVQLLSPKEIGAHLTRK